MIEFERYIMKTSKTKEFYRKHKKFFNVTAIILLSLFIVVSAVLIGTNIYMVSKADDKIITPDEALQIKDADCILVLGCFVRPDGTPSNMLYDRLDVGTSLYLDGAAPKILMSGDHGRTEYDEVNNMKQFALDRNIPSENIFMDHAGFSTYDSMYRARDIFGCKKIIIVTQEYHLYRALYVAESLGIEAYGVAADSREYVGQWTRDIREIAARTKDFFMVAFKMGPVVLGDAIPISGNGNLTNG